MWRAAGWSVVAALALSAHLFDSNALRGACAFAVLGLLGASAARTLRVPMAVLAVVALALLAKCGSDTLIDTLPAFIATFIAWLFARTLFGARRPLIARAIAALDGEAQLQDAAVCRYARTLTTVWAGYQVLLALAAATLGALAGAHALPPWCPGPRVFGAVILPAAVLVLLLGEFFLRRRLLPQAPHHRLPAFLTGLIRAWPSLLAD